MKGNPSHCDEWIDPWTGRKTGMIDKADGWTGRWTDKTGGHIRETDKTGKETRLEGKADT